jgi:hypothetical protein
VGGAIAAAWWAASSGRLAEYFNVDVTLIRVPVVVFTRFGGASLVRDPAMCVLIPGQQAPPSTDA